MEQTQVVSVVCLMRGDFPCPDRHLTSHGGVAKLISIWGCTLLVRVCFNVFARRYGFDYGSIHFVLMSTEHAFGPNSTQYQWLNDHLKSVDRAATPWLVFAGHRYKHTHTHYSYCLALWQQPGCLLIRVELQISYKTGSSTTSQLLNMRRIWSLTLVLLKIPSYSMYNMI